MKIKKEKKGGKIEKWENGKFKKGKRKRKIFFALGNFKILINSFYKMKFGCLWGWMNYIIVKPAPGTPKMYLKMKFENRVVKIK